MRMRIKAVAIAAAFLVAGAGGAYAQGYTTQDPGNMAPGNLSTGQLGPSTPSPTIGGQNRSGAVTDTGRNGPAAGRSGGTTVFHGTPGGYGSSTPFGPGQPAIPGTRSGTP